MKLGEADASGRRSPVATGEYVDIPCDLVISAVGEQVDSDLLISNGLSTMGFALPAAIGAALADPGRPVVAFTGDGGLAMALGDLATAAQTRAGIVVVVFNDRSLSLIDIKQRHRQMQRDGVELGTVDFAMVAEGMGVRGYRAADPDQYRDALDQAFRGAGPALIDAAVSPDGYLDQMLALRG
jgi:acetolactate synthase-1/2/3 large subunit